MKINKTLNKKLLLQAKEAETLGMKKLASNVYSAIEDGVDEAKEYSHDQLVKDVETDVWKMATRLLSYYQVKNLDALEFDKVIIASSERLIADLQEALGKGMEVFGQSEPAVPGQVINNKNIVSYLVSKGIDQKTVEYLINNHDDASYFDVANKTLVVLSKIDYNEYKKLYPQDIWNNVLETLVNNARVALSLIQDASKNLYGPYLASSSWTEKQKSFAQSWLKAAGYNLGQTGPKKDGIDGKWGAISFAALKDFQTKNGLSVTGIMSHETYKKLNNKLKE